MQLSDFLSSLPDFSPDTYESANTNFEALCRRWAQEKGTVILRGTGRYSYLGVDPWLSIRSKQNRTTLAGPTGQIWKAFDPPPMDVIDAVLSRFRMDEADGPLKSGLLGYLAYDLPNSNTTGKITTLDDLKLPDLLLYLHRVIWIYDKETAKLTEVKTENPLLKPKEPVERTYELTTPLFSNHDRRSYVRAVEEIKEAIRDGEIYQVNLSQRFSAGFSGSAFGLFTDLFAKNPAEYYAYINGGDHQIASTSPEQFLTLNGDKLSSRPIKGTAPRGTTPVEDNLNRKMLLTSDKESGELSMIVDLMRNDLSRVCRPGSVKVTTHKSLEAYENVFHLVSRVEGRIQPGTTPGKILNAAFPPGSITGCPKIRAMEFIDHAEPCARHLYTGSIGYISLHGTMDLSVAIRTAILKNDKIHLSVGGGIVIDSDPEMEYEETLHKGATFFKILGSPAEKKQPTVWHNGSFCSVKDAVTPVTNRGLRAGWGLFETILYRPGGFILFSDHLARFSHGLREIFNQELPTISWNSIATGVVEQSGLRNQEAVLRIQALLNPKAPLGYDLTIASEPYNRTPEPLNPPGKIYPHPRETPLADHKTMNHLFYIRAASPDYESIILNGDGTLSETARGNMLIIRNDRVIVPDSAHVLPGITQAFAIDQLKQQGRKIERHRVKPEEITESDQIVITSSLAGIFELKDLDGIPLRSDSRLTQELQNSYLESLTPSDMNNSCFPKREY